MTGPTVSVIVPVKDDPRLDGCLEALTTQTYKEGLVEIVVVDNGSSRPPQGPLLDHPRIRLLHEPRPGSYAARNNGIRHSTGDVVAFTDADCLPDATWLEHAVARLGEGADIVAGEVAVFAGEAGRPTPVEAFEMVQGFPQRRYATDLGWAATANMVTTRRAIDTVGPFDQRLRSGGDAEWGVRATGLGFRLEYDESVRVRHPARATFGDYYAKLLRVHQGAHDRATLTGDPSPVRLTLRSLVPPLGAWRRSDRPDVLLNGRARGAYVVGEFFVRYATATATMRVARDGPTSPSRASAS